MNLDERFSRIVHLGLGTAAAALSSTIFRSDLIPKQLDWLGSAGTLIAAVLLVLATHYAQRLRNVRLLFTWLLLLTLSIVIVIRATAIQRITISGTQQLLMLGWAPNKSAKVLGDCPGSTAKERLDCAGEEVIPQVYTGYYVAYWLFLTCYIFLFVSFIVLLCVTNFGRSPSSSPELPTQRQ